MKIVLFLLVTVLLAVGLSACNHSKMPSGEMYAYSFAHGGGMNPLVQTVYQLSYDNDTGKLMLYASGDCNGELISMEVDKEVMEQCRQLVKRHKLYKSRGFYKSNIMVLDAPSSSFHISFRNPSEFIDGSGNMPNSIYDGLNAIHQYLRTVVGDRKAEGHVDRIYNSDGIAGLHWTDGQVKVVTPDNSELPLKKALRESAGTSSSEINQMGYSRFRDGDRHFFVIHDYQHDHHRVYFSYDGTEKNLRMLQARDEADMLIGTFTDAQGHRYVFSSDGKVSKDGAEPVELLVGGASGKPMIIFDGHQMRGFKLTEKGVDFFGLKMPGDDKDNSIPAYSLSRVGDERELWPVVNERFLSRPMIESLSDSQLDLALNCIRMHNTMPDGGIMWFTDIGEVNHQLLDAEKRNREKSKQIENTDNTDTNQ